MRRAIYFLLWLMICGTSARSADWPQWRGPERNGNAPGESLPSVLPAKLKTVWRTEVGEGYSSPVVGGSRVFLMAREGNSEVYLALDRASGKILWKQAYPAPFRVHSAAVAAGPGPKATIAISEGRIYGFGITEILSCLDGETGKVLWRHDYSKEFNPIWPETGASASPLIEGDLCIAQIGKENHGGPAAFDKRTGKLIWKHDGDGPSYSSPEPLTFGGKRILTAFTQQSLVGLDIQSGRLLWSVPFKTSYNQNIVSPVAWKDLVIYTGTEQRIIARRIQNPEQSKSGAEPAIAWENKEHSSYMNSPVVHGDHVYILSEKKKGILVCLDAATGRTVWESPGRLGEYASIVTVGDKMLLLTDDATLRVIPMDPAGYKELAKWEVAPSPTWAHPAYVDSRFYLKDASHVACLEF